LIEDNGRHRLTAHNRQRICTTPPACSLRTTQWHSLRAASGYRGTWSGLEPALNGRIPLVLSPQILIILVKPSLNLSTKSGCDFNRLRAMDSGQMNIRYLCSFTTATYHSQQQLQWLHRSFAAVNLPPCSTFRV